MKYLTDNEWKFIKETKFTPTVFQCNAAKEGEFHAIMCFIWSTDLQYLQDYFEKEGFYIRKYHFGQKNDNLEVSWGKGAEEDKYYDELQLKWMKQREEQ